jgi:pimeloyl-ACP methyl ester carboxylesterase
MFTVCTLSFAVGSWGSTLALAYSQTYPAAVKSIVLRGVFLFLQEDMVSAKSLL